VQKTISARQQVLLGIGKHPATGAAAPGELVKEMVQIGVQAVHT
jgi:hypothetical protein